MPKSCDSALSHAFRHTNYRVLANTQWHTVVIGAACPEPLRIWLTAHCKGRCAWVITAHNPQAEIAAAHDNNACDTALKAWLDTSGHAYVPADSCAQNGSWPSEPGVCVLDMDEGLARSLALRFDQAAMVALPTEHTVKLVWIDI